MSTPFSRKMQGVATRLLGKYGSTALLVKAGGKVWDSVAGEFVFSDPTTHPLTGVPVPVESSLINGTTIQAGDITVIADYQLEPSMEDKVVIGGVQLSIVAVEPKLLNDDVVAYFIRCRK